MAAKLELRAGEVVQEEIKGDYWKKVLFTYSQMRGKIYITNQRIHVEVGFATILDLELNDIVELRKSNIALFIPTGIDVIMKDGKKHRLSVLKRNERLNKIQALMGR